MLLDGQLRRDFGIPTSGRTTIDLLPPGALDTDIDQRDVLPSLSLVVTPVEGLTLRAAYSETIARPTFRELTPVSQVLFGGETPFVGNPRSS